ncbi:hypothetical protein [Pseudomonas sp. NPDC089406]|uniref:hypothetical protein n=1 Tax=Pseudomonas sp. NPDC089406 TaxID=3364463 RepID=UPI00384A9821
MTNKQLAIDLLAYDTHMHEDSVDQLQQDAYLSLHNIISNQLNNIRQERSISPSDFIYAREHNAILIEGSRGSGKTTFLLKSLQKLKKDKELKLSVLRLIDPTLIETKENIVVVILSAIDSAIEQIQGETRGLTEAREALAEGLGLLDGIGSSSAYGAEWEDPKWVMSQGLRKAKKGRDFERALGQYIEEALRLLNKNAFVLTFDDVDTNFTHGYLILESVRKYLTNPKLVIILSGDLELYGRLLRKNIYNAFGEDVLRHDPTLIGFDQQRVGRSILELEEQYLLKIAPPQNRITMIPLGGLAQYKAKKISVLVKNIDTTHKESVELQAWVSQRIALLMHDSTPPTTNPFFNLLATEPLRLVISYMRALGSEPDSACRAIFNSFSTRLQTQGISGDSILNGDLDSSLRVIFEWISRQPDAPDLAKFGVPSEVSKAIALHCLAMLLSQTIKSHAGSALKSLLGLSLPLAMMQRPSLIERQNRDNLFNFLWNQLAISGADLAARLGAVNRSTESGIKLRAASFGSVGLANNVQLKNVQQNWYPPDSKDSPTNLEKKGTLAYLVRDLTLGHETVQYGSGWFLIDDLTDNRCDKFGEILKLITNKRYNARGEIMRSVSALSLLGVITDLLNSDKIKNLGDYSELQITPPFENHQQINTTESDTEDDEHYNEISSDHDINKSSFESFMHRMTMWHRYAIQEPQEISPSLLGRIATRIHDDLLSLDEKIPMRMRTGEILHRQIICILHGILATTTLVPGRKETPKTSDRAFVELLNKHTEHSIPNLFSIILSCPLVWLFLKPTGIGSKMLWKKAKDILEAKYQDKANQPPALTSLEEYTIHIAVEQEHSNKIHATTINFFEPLNLVPRYAN